MRPDSSRREMQSSEPGTKIIGGDESTIKSLHAPHQFKKSDSKSQTTVSI